MRNLLIDMDSIVSIVVPVYNVKHEYFKKCIDSILQASTEKIEVLIVDDCSTNGCENICDEYEINDDRVRTIHLNKNAGVSEARNIGVRESHGKWIVFVDSDDWLDVDYMQILMARFDEDADILMYSAVRESANGAYAFGTSGDIVEYTRTKDENSIYDLQSNLLKQSLISTPARFDVIKYVWGKAFRRDFLLNNHILFPDLNYCEDIVFMCKAFQNASKVIQVPERLYHYRLTGDSAIHSFRPNALNEQENFIRIIMKETEDDTVFYAALLSMQICITRYLYNRENTCSLLHKHKAAMNFFSKYPYSDIFTHVKYADMRKSEKIKALLLKHRLFFLYFIGTQLSYVKKKTYA